MIERNKNGRFVHGNVGGPGRPRKREETHRHFLSTVQRIIEYPDRFTEQQRALMVQLVTSLALEGPDHQAIAAIMVLVEMNGVNIELNRLAKLRSKLTQAYSSQ